MKYVLYLYDKDNPKETPIKIGYFDTYTEALDHYIKYHPEDYFFDICRSDQR